MSEKIASGGNIVPMSHGASVGYGAPSLTDEQRALALDPRAVWMARNIIALTAAEGYWRLPQIFAGCPFEAAQLYDKALAAGIMRIVDPKGGQPYQKPNHVTHSWCNAALAHHENPKG